MPTDPVSGQSIAWSKLALAHHWPSEFDRCVVIRNYHVCRRCLVLWPLTFVVYLLAALLIPADAVIWWLVGILLVVPGVVDFGLELLGKTATSPRRLVALTVPLGVGLGVLMACATIALLA